jgi:hypothetical protein
MTKKKIILGGILAALLMFIWSSIAHTILPIGEMGFSSTENEDAILAALKANLPGPGLYLMPTAEMYKARNLPKDQQEAAMRAGREKWTAGPRAFVNYHPDRAPFGFPHQLFHEFAADLVAGWILAFALAMAAVRVTSFGGRVGFVTLLGLLPYLVISVSHWNWYEFPFVYEMAEFLDTVIGSALAGVGLAWLFRKE